MTRLVVLLAALGANGEDPAVDGDLDVVLRVQAGQFGPDHIVVVRIFSSRRNTWSVRNGGGPVHGDSSQSARSGNTARNLSGACGRGSLTMLSLHCSRDHVVLGQSAASRSPGVRKP